MILSALERRPEIAEMSARAEALLRRIRRTGKGSPGGEIIVEPELVVRETTCPPPDGAAPPRT